MPTSELGFGALGFGTAGSGNHRRARTDDEAAAVLEAAWDAGVRYFDTAPHYGLGLAERRLGAFLATKPREQYLVSTKVGRLLEPNPDPTGQDTEGFVVPATHRRVWDFSPDGIRRSLDGSLERLGLTAVDVVLLHDPERWDLHRALDTGLDALAGLRGAGAVRGIGVGSMRTDALLAAARSGIVDVVMAAGRYTLASPDLEGPVLDACREHQVDVVAAAVFNGGLLASTPSTSSTFDYGAVPPATLERARRLETRCAAHGVTLRAAALQFPLVHPQVACVVVGGDTPAQIRQSAVELAHPVPSALWDDLRADGLIP